MKKTLIEPTRYVPFFGNDLRCEKYQKGQMGLNMGYGIGETLAFFAANYKPPLDPRLDSTKLNLNEAAVRRVVDTTSKYDIASAMDKYNFNVVSIPSLNNYSEGEYEADLFYSKNIQENECSAFLWHSQGGYGGTRRIVKNPALLNDVDCLIIVASGPGDYGAAKIIAEAKVPVWILVGEGDRKTTSPVDLWQWNINLHEAILKAGGISYLTLFTKENNFTDPHAILGLITNAWGTDGAKAIFDYKITGTIPTMNIYEWALSNKKGMPVVAPDGVFKPVASAYQPPVIELPPVEEKPIEDKVFVESFNLAGGEITIAWADGIVDVFKPEKGDRIRGLFGRCNKSGVVLRYTIDFEKATPLVIQNPRLNTPAVA